MNFNFKDTIQIAGHFKLVKEYKDGHKEVVVDEHNLLLLSGRTAMRNLVAGYQLQQNYVSKLAFGNNASTTDVNQPPAAASEQQAAQMQDVAIVPVTYAFQDDYSVTFLGVLDFDQANGTYVNEYMLRNEDGKGITYKTTKSVPKESDFRFRVYWTLNFQQQTTP